MAMNPTGLNNQPQNPLLYAPNQGGAGGPGTVGFGNTTNPTPPQSPTGTNPFQFYPTAGAPPVMNPPGSTGSTGPTQTITDNNGNVVTSPDYFGQAQNQNQWGLKELQKYYGTGVGSMLYQYLQSGGGYNAALTQQNVEATNAAMQHNITEGLNTLDTRLGGSGISMDSSTAALETGDYLSTAMTNMNAIDASIYYDMWNSSQNRELAALTESSRTAATGTANQPTGLGEVQAFLGLGQAGAGAASGIISALNPTADTGILDALAAA